MEFKIIEKTLVELDDCEEFCKQISETNIDPYVVEDMDMLPVTINYRSLLGQIMVSLLRIAIKEKKISFDKRTEHYMIFIRKENLPAKYREHVDEDLYVSVATLIDGNTFTFGVE